MWKLCRRIQRPVIQYHWFNNSFENKLELALAGSNPEHNKQAPLMGAPQQALQQIKEIEQRFCETHIYNQEE